jgi:hypothetical protein
MLAHHGEESENRKAAYIIALKDDQETLREDVEAFAPEQESRNFKD